MPISTTKEVNYIRVSDNSKTRIVFEIHVAPDGSSAAYVPCPDCDGIFTLDMEISVWICDGCRLAITIDKMNAFVDSANKALTVLSDNRKKGIWTWIRRALPQDL